MRGLPTKDQLKPANDQLRPARNQQPCWFSKL